MKNYEMEQERFHSLYLKKQGILLVFREIHRRGDYQVKRERHSSGGGRGARQDEAPILLQASLLIKSRKKRRWGSRSGMGLLSAALFRGGIQGEGRWNN